LGFEEAVFADDAFVADEELGAAAVGEDPDAGHVAELKKHVQNGGNVIRPGYGDFVVGLADEFVLGVAEEFAECGGDFDKFPARVDDGDVFGLDAGGVSAAERGERLILKRACEERFELSHVENPCCSKVTADMRPRQCCWTAEDEVKKQRSKEVMIFCWRPWRVCGRRIWYQAKSR